MGGVFALKRSNIKYNRFSLWDPLSKTREYLMFTLVTKEKEYVPK